MTRLSHTANEKYELCPYKYYLHYVMRYRSSLQSSALCFGNALDIALNSMLEGKDDYRDVFDCEWSKYKTQLDNIEYYDSDLDASLLSPIERDLLSKPMLYFLSLQRKGHKLLDAYKQEIFPSIKKVISIQEEVNLVGCDESGESTEDSIYGKIDLIAMIEHKGEVVKALLDNKTTSKPYPKTAVVNKDQLALYSNGFPDIEYYGYLTLNKVNFKTQIIIDKIPQEKKDKVLDRFVSTLTNIKENRFDKNRKSCYAFGRRCEFWTHCYQGYFSKDIYQLTKEE
jgi:hypothetical protein